MGRNEAIAEVVVAAPEDVLAKMRRGKAHYDEGLFAEALREFEAVVKVAPGNIDARVWVRKAREGSGDPHTTTGEEKTKVCLWQKLGMVSYRVCVNNYDCLTCDFDQQMQEKMAKGDTVEVEAAIRKFEALPGNERICRYALKGDVSFRLCSRCFRCGTCEFDQNMEDGLQEKLAKLATRRDTMKRKTAK